MSPYLYLSCSEGLSSLLSHADIKEFIHGIQTSVVPSVSHLLFADDSLAFPRTEGIEVENLKQVLLLYEVTGRQKINFDKSAIALGQGISVERKGDLRPLLRPQIVPFHGRHLGLPKLAGKIKKEMFKGLNERSGHHQWGGRVSFSPKRA